MGIMPTAPPVRDHDLGYVIGLGVALGNRPAKRTAIAFGLSPSRSSSWRISPRIGVDWGFCHRSSSSARRATVTMWPADHAAACGVCHAHRHHARPALPSSMNGGTLGLGPERPAAGSTVVGIVGALVRRRDGCGRAYPGQESAPRPVDTPRGAQDAQEGMPPGSLPPGPSPLIEPLIRTRTDAPEVLTLQPRLMQPRPPLAGAVHQSGARLACPLRS